MSEEKNIPGVATEKESDEVLEEIRTQTKDVLKELLAVAKMKPGQILVVGCSSSEIGSYKIGSHSSETIGQTVYKALYEELKPLGIYLAAQCCEHLNRALILETEAAEKYGYEPVNVMPQPKAGGSFATAAWQAFADPVAVEHIAAHAGMDIGDTLIGMHLKDVAVPVRLSIRQIGEAHLVCARTRRKFVGGVRAVYDERYL